MKFRWFSPVAAVFALVLSLRAADAVPDFNRDVRPILADKCYHCHGPDDAARKGKLRLDTPAGAAKVIKPGKALESEFYKRIVSTDPDSQMPPPESTLAKHLTPADIATLTAWLKSGAHYANHWAFESPKQAPLQIGRAHV